MAIEVNLEKYGHRKKGFLGFSWTAFFFNFLFLFLEEILKDFLSLYSLLFLLGLVFFQFRF